MYVRTCTCGNFLYLELITKTNNEMEIISYDNYTCTETISLTMKMCTCLFSLIPETEQGRVEHTQHYRKKERERPNVIHGLRNADCGLADCKPCPFQLNVHAQL